MEASLRKSLAIQCRVVGALMLREIITRYGRHNIGFLWLFVEPMIFTLAVMSLWELLQVGHGHGLSPAAFAITGYSSILMWRNIAGRCINSVEPNRVLMHHRNVRVIDIFIARALLEFLGATASFLLLGTAFCSLGLAEGPVNILAVLEGWMMLLWFGSSLGIFVGSFGIRYELVEKLWHPITYVMFPISGSLFMVDWLPPPLQKAVLWVPMVHGVEMIRAGFFGNSVRPHFDLGYLSAVCLVLTTLGLAQSRIVSRELVPE
jgi:capsular polysaccharide transport system permease protein